MINYMKFLARAKAYFRSTRQAKWKKQQIVQKLMELEAEFLVDELNRANEALEHAITARCQAGN